MQYLIGVDGGGTKTNIVAADKDSLELFFTKAHSSSWREQGIDFVVSNIKQSIYSQLIRADDTIVGMSLGLPYFGESPENEKPIISKFQAAFPGVPIYFSNDVEVGWAGSLGLKAGINVVSGTGSIAFGKNESGKSARCGGWSEFFGDEGSCYWIGKRVMELFSKQSDGRMEIDPLYEIVRSEFSLNDDFDFIDLMYKDYIGQRDKVASLQLLAQKAALNGSLSAIALYEEVIAELCLLVKALRDRLDFEKEKFNVSYSGGLFNVGELIIPEFSKRVQAIGGKLTGPEFGPAEGALLLSFSKFYPEGLPQIYEKLKNL